MLLKLFFVRFKRKSPLAPLYKRGEPMSMSKSPLYKRGEPMSTSKSLLYKRGELASLNKFKFDFLFPPFAKGGQGGFSFLLLLILLIPNLVLAQSLPTTIQQIKPSIVGVGTVQVTRRPPSQLMGTGFVVADGYHVITNYHVVDKDIDNEKKEFLAIFLQQGKQVKYRKVRILAEDREHDLALLRIEGTRLPALKIEKSAKPQEGQEIAFTGFPIGAVLGLYPVTHRGIISTISPVAIPAPSSRNLSAKMIKRLKNPYLVYQLDATAYPGNSGSPMYSPETGKVLGVINKVFIKESKENALQKPSGITYAIPARHIVKLLADSKITGF